jgi:hypothetical protein
MNATPTCSLCSAPIADYVPALHHLRLPNQAEVDICDACSKALAEWHAEKLARLFPTRQMKKLVGRKRRP